MYVGILVRRVWVTYSEDVQFEDLAHVCGNDSKKCVGYLQRRCPVCGPHSCTWEYW